MNLMIEIYSEEIPGRMQREAETKATALFGELLTANGLTFDAHGCWVSSTRMCLFATNVPAQTERTIEERRGPRLSSPDVAMAGFLKSTGLTKDQLRIAGDYYFADIESPAKTTAEIVPHVLHAFLDQMPWPKSMRWHNAATNTFTRPWIRPIRSIVCMLDEAVISFPVQGLDLVTGDTTIGHRFLNNAPITLNGFADYAQQLRDANVVISFEERRQLVWDEMTAVAAQQNLTIKPDDGLLDEVTGLVDYPFAHLGVIPARFMELPPEVLSTSMRVHQKYFTVQNADGTMAPFFGVITNVPAAVDSRLMLNGLERVLTARLSDAHFFYSTDVKVPLESLAAKCDGVIFHEKTGSLGDKLRRLQYVIDAFEGAAAKAPGAQNKATNPLALSPAEFAQLKRATILCKSDLFTQMVGEFPELQGIMGRLYATAQGEHPSVADALEQHYQPLGPTRTIPANAVSRALALIDKVDTLVGFLGHGVKPTGNKDPLAIRRTALGIIRLIVEAGGALDDAQLRQLVAKSMEAYTAKGAILLDTTDTDVFAFIQTRFEVYSKAN
jgi:glycyl-tRNA synthetase beta chain